MAKNRIKYFREKLGYSEEWLAEELGVSISTISRMEIDSSNVTMDRFLKTAKLFKISVIDLLDEKDLQLSKNYNSEIYGPIESSYIRFLIYDNEKLRRDCKYYQNEISVLQKNLDTIREQIKILVEYIIEGNINFLSLKKGKKK
jgi:transcriptional regulator with XRE-family HTH domain